MKQLLFLLFAHLSLANTLNLDEFKTTKYDCFINYVSTNYVACENHVYKANKLIFSISDNITFIDDYLDNILIISSKDGEKTLSLYKNNKLKSKEIASDINKAFLYEKGIILVSLASEIKILDFDFKNIYYKQLSNASISSASLNNDRHKLAIGFESGKIAIFDLANNDFLIKEIHKDNIYNVDYKNGLIISCSTDRNVIISDENLNEIKRINNDNLVYNCALSDDGSIYAYSCDVDNNICINDDLVKIDNLYLNSIIFDGFKLKLNAYSDILYEKDFK